MFHIKMSHSLLYCKNIKQNIFFFLIDNLQMTKYRPRKALMNIFIWNVFIQSLPFLKYSLTSIYMTLIYWLMSLTTHYTHLNSLRRRKSINGVGGGGISFLKITLSRTQILKLYFVEVPPKEEIGGNAMKIVCHCVERNCRFITRSRVVFFSKLLSNRNCLLIVV